jgi:hypothetical protein
MKMIELLLSQDAAIYTVHDNFLTTLPYVKVIPDLYIRVFTNMMSPLSIINEFIKDNLIYPYMKDLSKDIINTPSIYYHKDHNPMPTDQLIEFLNLITPTTDKKKWQRKVYELIKSYNSYVDTVCGKQVTDSELPSPNVKLTRFKSLTE